MPYQVGRRIAIYGNSVKVSFRNTLHVDKRGEVYILGGHRLTCGDSPDAADVARRWLALVLHDLIQSMREMCREHAMRGRSRRPLLHG